MDRSLDDLFVFTQVVDAGSFSAAGKALTLPTSTVSRRVARLEDRLGVRLLQRTTRKLSLTDAGRIYYDSGARITEDLAEADRQITEMQSTPRGRLRVTAPLEFGGIMPLICGFLAAYPEMKVELELANRTIDLIEEGFDVAIRAGNLPDSSLIAHKLADNDLGLFASPAYLERGTPKKPEDLRAHDCIFFSPLAPSASWNLRDGRKKVRVPVRGRIAVNHLLAAKQASVAGLGVALLPASFCINEIRDGELRRLLPEACPSEGSTWVVYPSKRHLPPRVRAFVDYLKENYATQAGL